MIIFPMTVFALVHLITCVLAVQRIMFGKMRVIHVPFLEVNINNLLMFGEDLLSVSSYG